ncbi:MAG TPA: DMT family transporter [Symbiobacteriaceae bacterium]|nr:DMT family transporter [Symbiobacteriaceae bacterium]
MRLLGSIYLATAASIWGAQYVVSKYVLEYVPPLTLLVIRLLIAGIIFGALALDKGQWRIKRQDVPLLASLGLIGFTISLGFQFWGTKLSSAHNGGLITSASPAFIVLFAAWLLRERLTWVRGTSLALATAGVVAVVGPESGGSVSGSDLLWVGNLCLVGAAVTWALYTVMGKLATERYSSLTVSLYATLAGIIFTTPVAYVSEWRGWSFPALPALVWWGIAFVGIVATAVAFYLWVLGFSMVDAGTGSLFFFAQPLVAATFGALLLGELLHWYFFVGAALIFAGVALSALQGSGGRGKADQPQRSGS